MPSAAGARARSRSALRDELEALEAWPAGRFRRKRPGRLRTWSAGWWTCGRVGRLSHPMARAVPTRAQQAGLLLADVPRSSLAKLIRQHRLEAKIRTALKRVLRRRRPKT
jgi:hypothetical protein